MSRHESPSEIEARRLEALDDLLASPCALPEGIEEQLLSIPDATARSPRRGLAVAAALVLAAGALALLIFE